MYNQILPMPETRERLELSQYKDDFGKPSLKFNKFLDLLGSEISEIDANLFALANIFSIKTSGGLLLDFIGGLFNVPRGGANDFVYRNLLLYKLQAENSAVRKDILNAAKKLSGDSNPWLVESLYNTVSWCVFTPNGRQISNSVLRTIKAGGVYALVGAQ